MSNKTREFIKLAAKYVLFLTAALTTLADSKAAEPASAPDAAPSAFLEYLNEEARKMEAFPVEYIAEVGNICQERYLSLGCAVGIFCYRFELSFERYLPFYRFKTRAAEATPDELNYCVQHMDEQLPKVQALILTSLYIFERIKRPALDEEVVVCRKNIDPKNIDPKKIFSLFRVVPSYQCGRVTSMFLPEYRPDPTISQSQWDEWAKVIQAYRGNEKIAFSKFGKPIYFKGYKFDPRNPTLAEWQSSLERYEETVKAQIGNLERAQLKDQAGNASAKPNRLRAVDYAKFALGPLDYLTYDRIALLEQFAAIETSGTASEREAASAFRDYWLTFQYHANKMYPRTSNQTPVFGANFSCFDLSLGTIAEQLWRSRVDYESDPTRADAEKRNKTYFYRKGIDRSQLLSPELREPNVGWNIDF